MTHDDNNIKNESSEILSEENIELPVKKKRPLWTRILCWTGGIVGGLLLLLVLLLCVATWWLTPARLASIISKEASAQVNADVAVSDVSYTLWSSFPLLNVEIDSISLRSRNFDNLPDSIRKNLPRNADFLLSVRQFRGGVNLPRLFAGQIWAKDINVDSIKVNLVDATDSLNNYSILASSGTKTRVPYFHIDGLSLGHTGQIAYTSVPSATDALVRLSGASLEPGKRSHHKDAYFLKLDGRVNAVSGGLPILNDFPFALAGDVAVRFDPFGISTSDYRVGLGNIKGVMAMDLKIGDTPGLNKFAYSLNDVTLRDILSFLPDDNYPVLEHLDANLAIDASARLTSPYIFTSAWLPSIEVDFAVPEGDVSYTLSDGRKYSMRRVGLKGKFKFDGRDPAASSIDVPEFFISGDGLSLFLNGKIDNLTTIPRIIARLRADGDLRTLSDAVPDLKPFGLSGNIDVDADVRFSLDGSTLSAALADVNLKSDKLAMNVGSTHLAISDFKASSSESYPDGLTMDALLNEIPVELKTETGHISLSDTKSRLNLKAANVRISGSLGSHKNGPVQRKVRLKLASDAIALNSPDMNTGLKDLTVDFSAGRLAKPILQRSFTKPAEWDNDSRSRSFVAHTPEFINVSLPAAAKNLLAYWKPDLKIKTSGGVFGTKVHPASTAIGAVELNATGDTVRIDRLTLRQGDTKGSLSAEISNLHQFLLSPGPAPLYLNIDTDIDTIQINQLARAYTDGHPRSAIARGDKTAMAEGRDSVALLIPRNIYANITARAKQTRYINLHLYDLYAKMRLADGRADIDTLRISADFGHAGMNMSFDTSDLQDMKMAAHIDVADVNIVRFFRNFRKLEKMMPEAKNVSGTISASADTRLRIFPSMFLDVPSVWADAFVRADNLSIKQSPLIRRITRMLMLPNHGTINVNDIALHAGIHSNLLEIFPFTFEMSKYKLVLGGINNFNGDLYYHIGVVDWPLKIPFGVNIKGDFHHPQLRFGGKDWHDINGARIAQGVDDYNSINLLRMGRQYMGEFVHTAATYEGQ